MRTSIILSTVLILAIASCDRPAQRAQQQHQQPATVAGSLKKYQGLTSGHNELLKAIEAKNLTLADLHTVLKIVRTLRVMETYQQDNLPSTKPLKGYIHNQNEALKLVDTLTKE